MKILVPIDFSDQAESALKYATALASHTGGSIHLLHVITPFVHSEYSGNSEDEQFEKTRLLDLLSIEHKLFSHYGVQSSFDVTFGDVSDEIVRTAIEKELSLIVMATHGDKGLSRFLFSSNTTSVVNKSPVPVLAIPTDAAFKPFNRIVFATDYDSADIKEIQELANFAEYFDAEINAVHVVNRFDEDEEDFDLTILQYFDNQLKENVSYAKISCDQYQHADVVEGIQCYVQDEHADLLVFSASHQNFLEKIFSRDITKEFIEHIRLPLLVLPDTESEED